MPINLHDECKVRLKEQLSLVLAEARLKNLLFIDPSSLYEVRNIKSIPKNGDIREKLESYISENPLFDFIYESLSKKVYEDSNCNPDHPDELLTFLDDYKDLSLLSDGLINELDTLPWEYIFTFNLGPFFTEYVAQEITKISPDIRLLKANGELTKRFPFSSEVFHRNGYLLGGGLWGLSPVEWEKDSLYVQINVNGFVGRYVTTTQESQAVDMFKSFIGLMIAMEVFKVGGSYPSGVVKNKFYVHKKTSNWVADDSKELSEDVSKAISNLQLDDWVGSFESDEKIRNFVTRRLELISKVFSKEEAERLRIAGQWLFDSYCGNNELLSFVQATIAIEVLLGEKAVSDVIGLGELLSNRCAYLIGNTHSKRKSILYEFKKIYDIRSRVVHRGKSRLDLYEKGLFYKLQEMNNKVIQKEVELLGGG